MTNFAALVKDDPDNILARTWSGSAYLANSFKIQINSRPHRAIKGEHECGRSKIEHDWRLHL